MRAAGDVVIYSQFLEVYDAEHFKITLIGRRFEHTTNLPFKLWWKKESHYTVLVLLIIQNIFNVLGKEPKNRG